MKLRAIVFFLGALLYSTLFTALACAYHLGKVSKERGKPAFSCVASPRSSVGYPIGHPVSEITVRCELTGDEREELYCPAIDWFFTSNGIPAGHRREESECPPYECGRTRDCAEVSEAGYYERHWSFHVLSPPGEYRAVVSLQRGGRTLRTATTDFEVY